MDSRNATRPRFEEVGAQVVATVHAMGTTPLRTAFRCPWQA